MIKAFAFLKDEQDRELINITDKETREFLYHNLFFCGRYKLKEGPAVHKSSTSVVMFAQDFGIYEDVFKKYKEGEKEGRMNERAFITSMKYLNSKDKEGELKKIFSNFTFSLKEEEGVERWINQNEFQDYCIKTFGPSQSIAIKFMKNEDQYRREKEIRSKNKLDENYVLGLLDGPLETKFQEAVSSLSHAFVEDIHLYKFGIFLPAADRSLDAIYRQERPSLNLIKDIMLQLTQGIKECHSKGSHSW